MKAVLDLTIFIFFVVPSFGDGSVQQVSTIVDLPKQKTMHRKSCIELNTYNWMHIMRCPMMRGT